MGGGLPTLHTVEQYSVSGYVRFLSEGMYYTLPPPLMLFPGYCCYPGFEICYITLLAAPFLCAGACVYVPVIVVDLVGVNALHRGWGDHLHRCLLSLDMCSRMKPLFTALQRLMQLISGPQTLAALGMQSQC